MGLAKSMIDKSKLWKQVSVECPGCSEDLWYKDKAIHLNPDRKRVVCPKCGFTGFHYLENNNVA